jgi:maleylpyruvate isomerase
VTPGPAVTAGWLRAGQTVLEGAVAALPDSAFGAPSRLPGWSRAHVVGHLARNAEALGRLAAWARTGVETPMYADAGQRAADIERSATLPPAVQRRDLHDTAAALDAALAALDAAAWAAQVRSALGRTIPAAQVPWLRVREVWLHAVDLDAGPGLPDLPADVVDALLDDVAPAMAARGQLPPLRLEPVDRARDWRLGPAAGAPDAVVLRGTAADLLGWLTGRGDGAALAASAGPVPSAPRWL